MKILFVRPRPSPETIGLQHVMIVEPLELEVIASLVSLDDTPVIIDMIMETRSIDHFIIKEKPDILCVTGYITNVPAIVHYCKTAKKINHNIVTVVGGVHCEVCPEDFNDRAIDYRVVRNAVRNFPLLLKHIQDRGDCPSGILKSGELTTQSSLPSIDFSFSFANRNLTARYRKHYFYIFHNRIALIKTAFGCPYSCNFCFCRQITQGKYFERPLSDVVHELRLIQEREIYIVDDDFFVSKDRVTNFIEANRLAQLDKHYLVYGRADFVVKHPRVIQKFRSIGLKTVILGIESFFDRDLEDYEKNIDAKTNEEAVRILNFYDIDIYATIIIAPDWGEAEFTACKEKMVDLGIHYVNLQPLTPLPGTGLTVMEDDLLIPYSDYTKWDLAHVTIRPRKMSVSDFYRRIISLYGNILFQVKFIMGYIRKYNILMLWKMAKGTYFVWLQYLRKIREVENEEATTT